MSGHIAALCHFPKLTYSRFQKMRAYFSDLKNLWDAALPDLVDAGLEETLAQEFLAWRAQNPQERIAERLQREEIKTVSLGEAGYPRLLAEITDPPITLFYRGVLPKDSAPHVAVVGTRRHTPYGAHACEHITSPLAREGLVIVSGLALGIDGIAHRAALDASGVTVAVLGSGVDHSHVHPSSHCLLAEQITRAGGAVVSEYPPGFMPTAYSFPARNRIIAGLSLGTLVAEAPMESGALITARCALDYNREVFAVPHPLTSVVGAGCNNLIKQGAHLATEAADILEALNLRSLSQLAIKNAPPPATPTQAAILLALSNGPKNIDEIIQISGLAGAMVTSNLTLMELKGLIKNLGGAQYIKK